MRAACKSVVSHGRSTTQPSEYRVFPASIALSCTATSRTGLPWASSMSRLMPWIFSASRSQKVQSGAGRMSVQYLILSSSATPISIG